MKILQIFLISLALPSFASSQKSWTLDTYENFSKGKNDGTLLNSLGEIRTGYATTKSEGTALEGVWSSAMHKGTFYVGSSDGKIFTATNGKSPKLFATIPNAVAVTALVFKGNTLYAGTMPNAAVWKVTAGNSKKVASIPDAESVWSLGVHGGNIYAGVGPKAKLFRINGGKAKLVFEAKDKRILSIATTKTHVWFGTSDNAIVYRHAPKTGKTIAMADFAGNEITAMTPFQSGVAVAANDIKWPSSGGTKSKRDIDEAKGDASKGHVPKMPSTGSKPGADKRPNSSVEIPRQGAAKGKGALYAISADGDFEQLHALTATYFTSLATTSEGSILAGSAEKGRIYLVSDASSSATVVDVDERVVATIASDNGDMALATFDSEAVYFLKPSSDQGSYTSKVFDAKSISDFGNISWLGAISTFYVRSGHTADAEKGWGPWKQLSSQRSIGQSFTSKTGVPRARYFQFKVKMAGKKSYLSRVQLRFLPSNKPTKIEKIETSAKGASAMAVVKEGPTKPRTRVVKIKWKVKNPDDDKTGYTLFARREGSATWTPLPLNKKPYTETSYEWNTEVFEDGYYRVKVVASDENSNASYSAKSSQEISRPFAVDNHGPKLGDVSVRYPRVAVTASDSLSAIREAAMRIGQGKWQLVGAKDLIFDDLTEVLSFELPKDLSKGTHLLSVRVADESGNISHKSYTIKR